MNTMERSRLLGWTLLLMGAGLIILRSASHHLGWTLVVRQSCWLLVGLGACWGARLFNYQRWLDGSLPLYVGCVVLLGLSLVMGRMAHGATRWLALGPLTFQPVELAKVATVLLAARILGDRCAGGQRADWRTVVTLLGIGTIPAGLAFLQPDLGSASVFLWIILAMLWVAGVPLRFFGALVGLAALLLPIGWHVLKAYQRLRLLTFINPHADPLGAGYTTIQARIAIGSGGLLGKGWMAGTQSQLNFLPERHTDFIFAVMAEELGFVGSVVLLGLFAAWLMEAWRTTYLVRELPGRLLAAGLTALVGYHVVVNIGMTMGLLPVVGIPLPLISYGGSAILTTWIAVGLLDSVRRWGPRF